MEEKKSKAQAASEPAAEKTEEPESTTAPEVKYSAEMLRKYCLKLFGVNQSTFDGATSGLSGTFTKNEMEAHIKKWLKKEVNN